MTKRKLIPLVALLALAGCGKEVELRVIEQREPIEGETYFVLKHPHTLVEDTTTRERYFLRGHWGDPGDTFTTTLQEAHGSKVMAAGG